MTPDQYVTVLEAARHLGVHRALIYQAIRDGHLPHVIIGQRIIRIPVAALHPDVIRSPLRRSQRRISPPSQTLPAEETSEVNPPVPPKSKLTPREPTHAHGMNETKFIGMSEAARRARVSSKTIASWADRGLVASIRIATLNNARLIDAQSLERYVNERKASS
ncbi:excisionase family DNA binding protein [Deinococcus yavapaiensis KR-236]|uniref:Excisionase family DNA binding protein n=2 Tax=Deinococcus TaxID=1298 RepID=A0A318S547_9DEIO|nr:excisionase family DNA binding protein [Deinococcus yavapaiensis KR-236]